MAPTVSPPIHEVKDELAVQGKVEAKAFKKSVYAWKEFLAAFAVFVADYAVYLVEELASYIPIALFVIFNLYNLQEYIATSQSIKAWWNNQRMGRIISMSAWIFGVLSMILKLLGISETIFEVTQKDQSATNDDNDGVDAGAGRFTFDKSLIFVSVTTILLVQLTSLAIGVLGLRPPADGG
nr:cellulose synthase-like protein H2 [Ziziphus jujuba var. spinosa]